jgi:hypothetical protein
MEISMTTPIVWLALWLASWFIINTEYNCYCSMDPRGRQHCWCELEMKP